MTATMTTPPALEPVTLEDARAHLRVTVTDEDTLLTRLIAAARRQVEQVTQRALITQTWRLYLDVWPPGRIVRLPIAPVQQVDAVTVYNVDGIPVSIDPSGFALDSIGSPPRLKVALGATPPGRTLNGIEIDFTAGYGSLAGDVPRPLVQAILMLVAQWFEYRVMDGDTTAAPTPSGFQALVAPYRSLRL